MRRRWLLIGGAALALLLCGLLFVFVIYGHVGAWVVRSKVVPKIERRLGRTVEIGDIEVRRGRAVLEDVVVRGPRDGDEPLARVDRIEAEIAFWPSLVGDVEIGRVVVDGVRVSARRDREGDNVSELTDRLRGGGEEGGGGGEGGRVVVDGVRVAARGDREGDNVSDLIDRLRGGGEEGGGGGEGGGGLGRLRPERVELRGAFLQLRDSAEGITVVASGVTAEAAPGEELSLLIGDLALMTDVGPYASAEGVVVTADPDNLVGSAAVEVGGGEVYLWRGMTLTGVSGSVAQGEQPGRL